MPELGSSVHVAGSIKPKDVLDARVKKLEATIAELRDQNDHLRASLNAGPSAALHQTVARLERENQRLREQLPPADGCAVAHVGQRSCCPLQLDRHGTVLPKAGEAVPVVLAVRAKHPRCLRALLGLKEAQGWVRRLDESKRNALHYCGLEGDDQCLEMLLELASAKTVSAADSDGLTPLIAATFARSLPMVRRLASTPGVSVATGDHEGNTGMHWAASNGDHEIVSALLEHATDKPALVSAPNREGRTPVHAAVFAGQPECVQLLVSEGKQKAMAPDKHGTTPVHMAANVPDVAVLSALLSALGVEAEPALAVVDSDGNMPLHVAVEARPC